MNSLYFLSALFAASPAMVLANGGGYLQGIKSTGPFRPVNVDSVEMVSEKLDIELKQDAAVISITYQLHNPGEAVKVEMGFPCSVAVKMEYNDGKAAPVESLPQLKDFTLTADGKAVESKLVEDHATLPAGEKAEVAMGIITGWQVVNLPFAAGQTRTVCVGYRNPYYRSVDYMSDNSYKSAPGMSYLFSAAALWKGAIKSGEVTVRATGIKADEVSLSHPKRFQRDGSTWTWKFSDFEPTLQDDLEIKVGEAEFGQWHKEGTYVARGNYVDELRKSGKWFFLSQQFTAAASSRLSMSSEDAEELISDDSPETRERIQRSLPWVEGAKGDGIGESVTLTMNKPVKATRLLIYNGHRAKDSSESSRETFQLHNRVKRLGVSLNGRAPFSVELPDSCETEGIVDLPQDAGALETVKLTIEAVYRGARFRDTCISAVEVEVPLSKAPVIHGSR